MGHYVCYTLRAGGFWDLHDDLQRKVKRLNNINNIMITPHLMFYIRNN